MRAYSIARPSRGRDRSLMFAETYLRAAGLDRVKAAMRAREPRSVAVARPGVEAS
jgi:hypothetical protein